MKFFPFRQVVFYISSDKKGAAATSSLDATSFTLHNLKRIILFGSGSEEWAYRLIGFVCGFYCQTINILLTNPLWFSQLIFYHWGCWLHILYSHSLTCTHPPALFAGWKCGKNALTGRVNFSFFLQKQTNRRAACCSSFRYSFSFSFYFNVKRRPFASIYGIGRVTYGWTHLHFPYFILFMQLTYFGVDFILLNFFFVILRIGWFEYEHLSFYGQFSNKWKSRIEICR